ncbi:MAG: tetratricopeptide repeat protein [Bacteroidetes bacterium]|nr:tetratricopeptide repeat protein [Bacteroidota bacterium]
MQSLYITRQILPYQKQDYAGSIKLYEQLIADIAVSTEVYFNLGNSYFKEGNVPGAIINYEELKTYPEDEDIEFNLGNCFIKGS